VLKDFGDCRKDVEVKAAADKVTKQSPAVHTGLYENGDKGR